LSDITGERGSVETYGDGKGGWSGYNIGGQFAFLSDGTNWGIYNDIDNRWMMYGDRTSTSLMYNGIEKFTTTATGAYMENSLQVFNTVQASVLKGNLSTSYLYGTIPIENLPSNMGGVGTYAFAAYQAANTVGYFTSVTPGDDIPGSVLKWANSCVENGTVGWRNITLNGTWRCMGETGTFFNGTTYDVSSSINTRTTLWLRIA